MAEPEGSRLFTIGYRGRAVADVLAELKAYDVQVLADVRAVAESSVEGFSADELGPRLAAAEIDYVPLGELGDFQPESYEDYMDSDEWSTAYATLVKIASERTTCLFSPEPSAAAPGRALLGTRLRQDGFRVIHLTPAGPREAVTFDGA